MYRRGNLVPLGECIKVGLCFLYQGIVLRWSKKQGVMENWCQTQNKWNRAEWFDNFDNKEYPLVDNPEIKKLVWQEIQPHELGQFIMSGWQVEIKDIDSRSSNCHCRILAVSPGVKFFAFFPTRTPYTEG